MKMKAKRVKPKLFRVKVVVMGDSGVGKTSILLRYDGQGFTSCLSQSIGASFISSMVKCNDTEVEMNIWDTAGQERFRSMVPLYLRNANAAIFVYDITRYDSFRNLKLFVSELERHAPSEAIRYVMANKSDLEEVRVITELEGRQYAESIGACYFETSAMNGRGIEKGMRTIAEDLLKAGRPEEPKKDHIQVGGGDGPADNTDPEQKEHRFCCALI